MLGLAIDSANQTASAALWRSSDDSAETAACHCTIIGDGYLSSDEGKADQLINLIERLLAEQSWGYTDLDLIAVNRGPGSFTGIRSAVALARGLALATELPVLGVTSNQAVAARLGPGDDDGPLLVALDARRGEVYAQTFAAGGRPLSEIEAKSPHAVIADLGSGYWRLAGSGAHLVEAALADESRSRQIETPPLDAAAVAHAAAARLADGETPDRGVALRPLYVRAPDAIPPAPLIKPAPTLEVLA